VSYRTAYLSLTVLTYHSIATVQKVRLKSRFVQVGIEYTYGKVYIYVYTQGSPAEIQTPSHWNVIDRSMTALQPVLSPSSILLPPSSYCAFITASKTKIA
jgi:hypothetical protein